MFQMYIFGFQTKIEFPNNNVSNACNIQYVSNIHGAIPITGVCRFAIEIKRILVIYFLVSKIMAKVVEEEGTDLVIVGKQSIDGDYGQTAQMLATQLDWAQGTSLYSVRKIIVFSQIRTLHLEPFT